MQIEILAEGLDEVRQYLSDHHDPDVDLSLSSVMDAEDMAPWRHADPAGKSWWAEFRWAVARRSACSR